MVQYINKAAVVAEIERRRREIPKNETDKALRAVYGNEAFVLTGLLSFLDTLEVKEVDLSAAVERYVDQHKSELQGYMDIRRIARHFFELGLKAAQKGEEV